SVARLAATTSSAISNGRAPRTSSATSGIAVRVTTEPRAEIVWPAQSFMKSGCRQSDAFSISGRAYRARPLERDQRAIGQLALQVARGTDEPAAERCAFVGFARQGDRDEHDGRDEEQAEQDADPSLSIHASRVDRPGTAASPTLAATPRPTRTRI